MISIFFIFRLSARIFFFFLFWKLIFFTGQFLLFLCLLGGVIGSVCPTTDASDVFHVYVDPLGDDARSGLTASEAVKTLQKASYIVTERLSSCHKNTVVHLGAGVFHDDYDRDTRWGFSMPGHYITIRGAGMWTGGTVFDGSTATRSTPYWLRIARFDVFVLCLMCVLIVCFRCFFEETILIGETNKTSSLRTSEFKTFITDCMFQENDAVVLKIPT